MTKQNYSTRNYGEGGKALELNELDGTGEVARPARSRASAYRDEYAVQAMKVCRLGATDAELADFFGVSVSALKRWQRAHPEFRESVKKGKILADAEAPDRLFTRACGYSRVAIKVATHKGRITDRLEYVKHYPPEVSACILWLKNRRPDLWRDKVNMEVSGAEATNRTEGEWTPTPADEEAARPITDIRTNLRQKQELQQEHPHNLT